MMMKLEWKAADGRTRAVNLEPDMTIGRDAGCSLVVDDPSVSRVHAKIVRSDEGLALVDQNSSYGVYVDGRRVPGVKLRAGQEIRLGETTFTCSDPSVTSTRTFTSAENVADVVELRRNYEMLRATFELTRAIGVEHDLDRMLARILDTAFDILSAERGSIEIFRKGTTEIALQTTRARREGDAAEISQTIREEVVRTRRGLIVSDAATDARFSRSRSIWASGVHSAMYVPMLYEDEVRGILHVDSSFATNVFTKTDLALFTAIANHAALAIEASAVRAEVAQVKDEERQRLASILEALPIGVVLLDADHAVLHANPCGRAALATLEAEVDRPLDRLGEWTLDEVVATSARGPVDIYATGDRRTIFQVVASSHRSQIVVALSDVTTVRDRASQAAHAERLALVGQLSGGIAHDFNNFLAVIRSNVELLVEDVQTPGLTADVLSELDVIDQAAQRGARLTDQLLTFSRQRSGTPTAVDLDAVLEGIDPILRRAAPKHSVELELAPDLPRVWMDATQLEQVVMNLVVNARDASPEGRPIRIVTSIEDGGVVVRVSDRGTGMSPELIEHVFEPFFTTKEVGRGSGLGLATVHGVVKDAGGRVEIDSVVGEGTTFTVWFPCKPEKMRRAG